MNMNWIWKVWMNWHISFENVVIACWCTPKITLISFKQKKKNSFIHFKVEKVLLSLTLLFDHSSRILALILTRTKLPNVSESDLIVTDLLFAKVSWFFWIFSKLLSFNKHLKFIQQSKHISNTCNCTAYANKVQI